MTKQPRSEAKEEDIIRNGIEVLWSKGYNGTSVNDIVKAAGIPKGSFYFYFDSKEDFAVNAIEYYFQMQYLPVLEVLQNEALSPKKRLELFYEYRAKVAKEEANCRRGCMYCTISSEMSEHSEKIRNKINQLQDMAIDTMVAIAQQAQEKGEIDQSINVRDVIIFLDDAAKGAMLRTKEIQDTYPIDNVMNMTRAILLK